MPRFSAVLAAIVCVALFDSFKAKAAYEPSFDARQWGQQKLTEIVERAFSDRSLAEEGNFLPRLVVVLQQAGRYEESFKVLGLVVSDWPYGLGTQFDPVGVSAHDLFLVAKATEDKETQQEFRWRAARAAARNASDGRLCGP